MAAFATVFGSTGTEADAGDLFSANSKFRSSHKVTASVVGSAAAPPEDAPSAAKPTPGGTPAVSLPGRAGQRAKVRARKAEAAAATEAAAAAEAAAPAAPVGKRTRGATAGKYHVAPTPAAAVKSAATKRKADALQAIPQTATTKRTKGITAAAAPAASEATGAAEGPEHHQAVLPVSAKGRRGKAAKDAAAAAELVVPAKAVGDGASVKGVRAKRGKAAQSAVVAPDGGEQELSDVAEAGAAVEAVPKIRAKKAKKAKKAAAGVRDTVVSAAKSQERGESDPPAHETVLQAAPDARVEAVAPLPFKVLTPAEEEEQLLRTIFVGNLPATWKGKAVKRLFTQYGKVESVRLRSVPVDLAKKMPRKAAVLSGAIAAERGTLHAYVVFSDNASATAALAHNMQEVEELHIRVDRATRKRADGGGSASAAGGGPDGVEYARARSVFVGNLHFDVQDEELVRLFSDAAVDPELAGAVTAVRVVRDRATNVGKGVAFVELKSKDAARAALGLDKRELHGRPMRVTRVKPPAPGSKSTGQARPPISNRQGAERRTHAPFSAAGPQRIGGEKPGGGKAAPLWMGLQTKGPSKGVRGSGTAVKPLKRGAPAVTPYTSSPKDAPGRMKSGKRPAVASRKMAKGPSGASSGVAKPKGGRAGGKQPWRS